MGAYKLAVSIVAISWIDQFALHTFALAYEKLRGQIIRIHFRT